MLLSPTVIGFNVSWRILNLIISSVLLSPIVAHRIIRLHHHPYVLMVISGDMKGHIQIAITVAACVIAIANLAYVTRAVIGGRTLVASQTAQLYSTYAIMGVHRTITYDCPTAYHAHDFPLTIPPALVDPGLVMLTVEESAHYPLLGDLSDDEWLSLTSAGVGYVRLGPDQRRFVVTMFHEMHCLRVLNLAIGGSSRASMDHVTHCLNYLRLMALCSADITLESGDFMARDFSVELVGETRVCRDWTAVYSAMHDNYAEWLNSTTRVSDSLFS